VLPNAQATCTDGVISLVSCNAGWVKYPCT
jgi:hypothetical protein